MNRNEKILTSIGVVSILLSTLFIYSAYAGFSRREAVEEIVGQAFARDMNKLSPVLEIEVYGSDESLKERLVKEDDLILNNFLNLTKNIMTDTGTGTSYMYLTDDSGTERDLWFRYSTSNNAFVDTDTGQLGGYIQVGTGTGAAGRTNYTLGSGVESKVGVSEPSYSSGNVSFSASIAMTASYTITESGFYVYWWDYNVSPFYFLLFRDTFSGISVVNGDTVVVTYYLSLESTGFTDNFGKILAGLFRKSSQSQSYQISLTEEGGSSVSMTVSAGNEANWLFDTISSPMSGIKVGTSSAAVGRGNYSLGASVGNITGNSDPSVAGANVSTSATITMSSAQTITEAGFFIRGKDIYGNAYYIMLWRTTFSGVSVGAGQAITIEFTVTH